MNGNPTISHPAAFTHKSCAHWPPGSLAACDPPDYSEDNHYSEAEARGVVEMLLRHGLAGEHKIFPIHAWIETL